MTDNINNKILKLISLYESEKQRADSLSSELEVVKSENFRYKEQIKDLDKQIEDLKLSNAFLVAGDVDSSKEIIAKLIREIDNCIKLLEN